MAHAVYKAQGARAELLRKLLPELTNLDEMESYAAVLAGVQLSDHAMHWWEQGERRAAMWKITRPGATKVDVSVLFERALEEGWIPKGWRYVAWHAPSYSRRPEQRILRTMPLWIYGMLHVEQLELGLGALREWMAWGNLLGYRIQALPQTRFFSHSQMQAQRAHEHGQDTNRWKGNVTGIGVARAILSRVGFPSPARGEEKLREQWALAVRRGAAIRGGSTHPLTAANSPLALVEKVRAQGLGIHWSPQSDGSAAAYLTVGMPPGFADPPALERNLSSGKGARASAAAPAPFGSPSPAVRG